MNELYHHGIKGQKWGVRRYQNPDGSLTAAGRKKLNKDTFNQLKTINKRYNTSPEIKDRAHANYDAAVLVRNSISKQTKNEFKKAYKKYDNAEATLEEMRWDTYKVKGKEQIKKTEQYRKEYEAIKKKAAKEIIGKYSNKNIGSFKNKKKGSDYIAHILIDITNEETEYGNKYADWWYNGEQFKN